MDQSAATHRNHDESLVVRLFGGDVTSSERESALTLVADCDSCAALFADLGDIAAATSALPVPPRPRDFTLSAADAELLRPARRRGLGRVLGLGPLRSLGGSLVALGVAGFILAGSSSLLPQLAGTATTAQDARGAYADKDVTLVPNLPGALGATPQSIPNDLNGNRGSMSPATSPIPVYGPAGSSPTTGGVTGSATGSGLVFGTEATGGLVVHSTIQPPTAGPSQATGGPISGSTDWRLVAAAASIALALVGLLLLFVPRRSSRRSGR